MVVTDLQQAGWEAKDEGGLPDGVNVEVDHHPPPPGNLALTSAERRDRRVVAAIHNFGTARRACPCGYRRRQGDRATEVTMAPLPRRKSS